MALPLILRAGAAVLPKAAKYFRKEKFMGAAEVVAPKALPAPAAAAAAKVPPSALKIATKNAVKVAPIGASPFLGADKEQASPSAAAAPAETKSDTVNTENVKRPAVKISKPAKAVKVEAAPKVEEPKTEPVKPSIKAQDSASSVQLYGNVDGYGSEHERPELPKSVDPTEGMSEDQLKKIGLDTSNAELEASGSKGSIARFLEGNIDDPNSVAYKKYGAGYGREVMKRRAASQK